MGRIWQCVERQLVDVHGRPNWTKTALSKCCGACTRISCAWWSSHSAMGGSGSATKKVTACCGRRIPLHSSRMVCGHVVKSSVRRTFLAILHSRLSIPCIYHVRILMYRSCLRGSKVPSWWRVTANSCTKSGWCASAWACASGGLRGWNSSRKRSWAGLMWLSVRWHCCGCISTWFSVA